MFRLFSSQAKRADELHDRDFDLFERVNNQPFLRTFYDRVFLTLLFHVYQTIVEFLQSEMKELDVNSQKLVANRNAIIAACKIKLAEEKTRYVAAYSDFLEVNTLSVTATGPDDNPIFSYTPLRTKEDLDVAIKRYSDEVDDLIKKVCLKLTESTKTIEQLYGEYNERYQWSDRQLGLCLEYMSDIMEKAEEVVRETRRLGVTKG